MKPTNNTFCFLSDIVHCCAYLKMCCLSIGTLTVRVKDRKEKGGKEPAGVKYTSRRRVKRLLGRDYVARTPDIA